MIGLRRYQRRQLNKHLVQERANLQALRMRIRSDFRYHPDLKVEWHNHWQNLYAKARSAS